MPQGISKVVPNFKKLTFITSVKEFIISVFIKAVIQIMWHTFTKVTKFPLFFIYLQQQG
jgi:hypothetical protein